MTTAAGPDGRTWRNHAACLREDPELFWPVGYTGVGMLQAEEACAVCRRCPVMDWCLATALEEKQEDGVWGATFPDERRLMKRRAQRKARR